MARRKNSAEMLDILRRISRDEKTRGPRPAQKSGASDGRHQDDGPPPARPLTSLQARETQEASHFDPARINIVPGRDPGKSVQGDRKGKEVAREVARGNENDGTTGRIRKAFLSVLSGGRPAASRPVSSPPAPSRSAASSRMDEPPAPTFGAPEGFSRKTRNREEVPGRLPMAAGGLEEPLSLAASGRSRAKTKTSEASNAPPAGAVQPLAISGAGPARHGPPNGPQPAPQLEGASASPHAEFAPLGQRSPFAPPEGGVKEWPGTAFSPEAPEGIFSPRETAPLIPAEDRVEPPVSDSAETQAIPAPEAGEDSDLEDAAPPLPLPEEPAARKPSKPPKAKKTKALLGSSGLLGASSAAQKLLTVFAGRMKGQDLLGRLKKRFHFRVVTIGLYAVVAIGAMLLMAFILNPRDSGSREKENLLPTESQDSETGDASALKNLETVGSGAPIAPAVRNVEKVGAGQSPATPAEAAADGSFLLDTSEKGKKGWYVQIQAFLFEKECDLIVEHLKLLGYQSIWREPQLQKQGNVFNLLIGPFPNKKEAETEIPRYKDLMVKTPLKKPKLKRTEPFLRKKD